MLVDLHNHTTLCNHATGSMEEYILKAIEKKIDIFGFTDHAFMSYDKEYRMGVNDCKNYEKSVNYLQEKYKNKIEILLGYEVDFMPNYMEDKILNADVDYLIGSVHFLDDWGFDNPEFIGEYKSKNIDDIWIKYFYSIEQLANSRLFNIVGHIDLLKIFKFLPNQDIQILAKKALIAIKNANMAVEINSAGFRKPIKEQYPSKQLLELMYQMDIDITFGSDAHSINQISANSSDIYNIAKEVGYSKLAIFRKKKKIYIEF